MYTPGDSGDIVSPCYSFLGEHVLNIGQLFQLKGGKKYKKKNVEWLSNELHSLLYNLVNIA